MFRRFIIVMLTIGALTSCALAALDRRIVRVNPTKSFRICLSTDPDFGFFGRKLYFAGDNDISPAWNIPGWYRRGGTASTTSFTWIVRKQQRPGLGATTQQFVWCFTVKLWLLIVLLPIYPTVSFISGAVSRRRRRRRGLCRGCGYDLTGNESGVCPECGLSIGLETTRI